MHKNHKLNDRKPVSMETKRTISVQQKKNVVILICILFVLTNQLIVTFWIDDLDVFCMNPCDGEREAENENETIDDAIWIKCYEFWCVE